MNLTSACGLALSVMLLACGGGGSDASIGVSDGNTSASIGSDLLLTVRVAPGESSGFTAKVGPDGARISVNSGQRIEIRADRPATLQIESNGVSFNIAPTGDTLWSGKPESRVQTSVRFQFSALGNPKNRTTLTFDITP